MKSMKLFALSLSVLIATACGERGDPEAGVDFRVNSLSAESTDINTTCEHSEVGGGVFVKTNADVELANVSIREDDSVAIEVDSYEIEYTALDGGPALTGHHYPFEISQILSSNSTVGFEVEMLPIVTKKQYLNATTDTTNYTKISLYQAHYTFFGTTEFEVSVQAEGDITFALGNNYIVKCE